MKITSLKELTEKLLPLRAGYKDYLSVLQSCDFEKIDLTPFFFFRNECYTRNLVLRTDWFELILLCWERGQRTPIHNHAGSECLMLGIRGEVQEDRYDLKQLENTCELTKAETVSVKAFELCHVNDDRGVHEISNVYSGRSATLHLYTPSIPSCTLYDPVSKKTRIKQMSYYSVGGQLC